MKDPTFDALLAEYAISFGRLLFVAETPAAERAEVIKKYGAALKALSAYVESLKGYEEVNT